MVYFIFYQFVNLIIGSFMARSYKKPFLKKVIVRIDFTANYELPQKGLPKEVSDIILRLFPIPEPREVLSKHVQLSPQGIKESEKKQKHLFFHGKEREKTLCLTPSFLYIEVRRYETFNKLKDEFFAVIDRLSEKEEFSIMRFGLRYINNVNIEDGKVFEWDKYLNPNLLKMFDIPSDKKHLSRAFSNLAQQFDDTMILNFQYGMHNPDFPSRIRKKLFILDFDSYYQGVFKREEIKANFDLAHDRIEQLFENSITDDLRFLMEEEHG